jgi:hypothetical protein
MTDKPADPKDKFREALERKRGQQAARAEADVHGESKVHGEHAAAGGKRTFRRKSGG